MEAQVEMKHTYTYVMRSVAILSGSGIFKDKFMKTFDSVEDGEKWVEEMEERFKDDGGCFLYEYFEQDEPVVKHKPTTTTQIKVEDWLVGLEEREARRQRRLERGE